MGQRRGGGSGGKISIASKETSSCKEKSDMKVCAEGGCRRDQRFIYGKKDMPAPLGQPRVKTRLKNTTTTRWQNADYRFCHLGRVCRE